MFYILGQSVENKLKGSLNCTPRPPGLRTRGGRMYLTDQHLVILNCVYYWSIQNKTPITFVRSISNTCNNSFYSMYCMYVASTELNSYFQFQLKHSGMLKMT